MKKRTVLLSALLTLMVFVGITGCYRDDDNYYYNYGDLTFWNDDLNEDIVVTVDGTVTARITFNVEPFNCNASGRANFYLTDGYHSYYAYSVNTNRTWSGTTYVNGNRCKLLELYR